MAAPVYRFAADAGTMVSADISPVVPSAGRQPETVPSSLTNKKRLSLNDELLLNTCPVTPLPGIETVSGSLAVTWLTGLTLYKGDVSVPFEETQNEHIT